MYKLTEEDRRIAQMMADQQIAQRSQPSQSSGGGGLGSFLLGLLPGGSLLDKGLRGQEITGGDVATEVGLSLLPFGIGKLARGMGGMFKGGRAAADASADAATTALRSTPQTPSLAKGMLRQSTISPNSTLKTASEQDRLIETARRLPGLRGSSTRKFNNVEAEIGKKTDEVDQLLKGVDSTLPSSEFGRKVSAVHSEIVDPLEAKRFGTEYNNIVSEVFGKSVPDQLTTTDINNLRRAVNKQMSGVYKKIDAGTQLTDKDEALLKLRSALSNELESLAPKAVSGQVKSLNRDVSTLMDGIPEFKRASEEAGKLPILGRVPFVSPLFGAVTQNAADYGGRALASKTGQFLLPQAGVRLGADALGLRTPPGDSTPSTGLPGTATPSDPLSLLGGGTDPLAAMTGGAGSSSIYTLENAAKDIQNDLQATGGENMEKYMKLYEFLNPTGGAGGKDAAKQNAAMTGLTQLEQMFQQAGGGQGIPGFLQKLLGMGRMNPEVEAYDKLKKTIAVPLARAMGETGPLSDLDIKTWVNALPDVSDTPEAAQAKLQFLMGQLSARSGASGGSEDIISALQAAGAL